MCDTIGGECIDFAHDWEVFLDPCVGVVDIEAWAEGADPVEGSLLVGNSTLAGYDVPNNCIAILL